MQNLYEALERYSTAYDKAVRRCEAECALPGQTYYLDDGSILCVPRQDGDNRFPYGENGFNVWTYASGYMHANDGLFSLFLRAAEGQEPKIAFFAGQTGGKVLSLLPVPVLDETEWGEVIRYTVFNETCTYYITETPAFLFGVRVFVDEKNQVYFSVAALNRSLNEEKLYLSVYMNPYLCHSIYESSEDRWFRRCQFTEKANDELGKFVFTVNEDLSRTESISNFGVLNQQFTAEEGVHLEKVEATTSRKQYVGGGYRSLCGAEALKQGTFHIPLYVTTFTDIAIAGELVHMRMEPGSRGGMELRFSYLTNCSDTEAYQTLLDTIDSETVNRVIAATAQRMGKEEGNMFCTFEEGVDKAYNAKNMTHFFASLKKQVEFCSLIKGYVQLSPNSLVGIRDVFQAIEGMLYYRPDKAREKMLEAFSFLAPNGRFPRQYGLPKNEQSAPPMDLRQFIDQGCWVIDTVISYLKFTGDFAFLKEVCGYYEIVDEQKRLVRKSEQRDTVLEHLFRVMDYLTDKQDAQTGCIKILYGDWNDALDGLGVSREPLKEFGSGVSVMATLQVYRNLTQMMELLCELGGFQEKIDRYQKLRKRLEQGLWENAVIENEQGQKRIVHGWGDKKSYYVGSFCDPDGRPRYGLTSNAFWVLSGLYEKDSSIKDVIMEAYEQLDSKYGFQTFEPCFYPDAKGVGRIYKLPPGTAENGASYIHATAFAIMSLFMMGETEKAWQQMMKILPFTHEKLSCSPYVMPNSYGFNPTLNIDGESMQDWQTGSSNVVLKTFIRYILGFMPEFHGIMIQSANWCPFRKYTFEILYRGKKIRVNYSRNEGGKRIFYVDGRERKGEWNTALKVSTLYLDETEICDGMTIEMKD